MAWTWAALLLFMALLGRCSAQGEQSAMDALSAAWGVEGWNNQTSYCNWTGVTCEQVNSAVSSMCATERGEVSPNDPQRSLGPGESGRHDTVGDRPAILVAVLVRSLRSTVSPLTVQRCLAGQLFYGSIPTELGLLAELSHLCGLYTLCGT